MNAEQQPDERPMPTVRDGCLRCSVTSDEISRGDAIVSPTGLAHRESSGGWTVCGKNATGPGWWWPL